MSVCRSSSCRPPDSGGTMLWAVPDGSRPSYCAPKSTERMRTTSIRLLRATSSPSVVSAGRFVIIRTPPCVPERASDSPQIYAMRHPFPEIPGSNNFAVIRKVTEGSHPRRPSGVTNEMWNLIQHCWGQSPLDRPTAEHVESVLVRLAAPGLYDC